MSPFNPTLHMEGPVNLNTSESWENWKNTHQGLSLLERKQPQPVTMKPKIASYKGKYWWQVHNIWQSYEEDKERSFLDQGSYYFSHALGKSNGCHCLKEEVFKN